VVVGEEMEDSMTCLARRSFDRGYVRDTVRAHRYYCSLAAWAPARLGVIHLLRFDVSEG
jgi:hypothetical protein